MVKSLSNQIQMITGSRTIAAPICTIARIMTAKANRPAPGTPASLKPMPASKDWMIAMPMTPWDTARMVAPARSRKCSL